MHIDELCKRLAQNITEKEVFFLKVEDITFFKHFKKQNLLNFNDDAGGAVISYLSRLLEHNNNDDTLKSEIIDVINQNLSLDVNYNYYTFTNLIKLLLKFSNKEIEEKIENYKKLFLMDNSIWLCKSLLIRDITDTKSLYLDCISSLLRYEIEESNSWKTKSAYSFYKSGIYIIDDLLEKSPYKENFIEILKKEDVFEFLKQQYSDIYQQCDDISYLDRQYIENFEKDIQREKTYNIQNLMVKYMAIHLKTQRNETKVSNLLESEIPMFRKLGFYAICCNFEQYKDTFFKAFNNVQEIDIGYCLYEIMTIFEYINVNDKDCTWGNEIKDKLFSLNEHLKFRLLHSLKNHEIFIDEFLILKDKYKTEIEDPKITFRIRSSVVQQKSPIDPTELAKKTIADQIRYIDAYIEPDPYDGLSFDTPIVTKSKLLEDFKDIVSQNVNTYLDSNEFNLITSTDVKTAVLDILSKSIEKNEDIDFEKVINLINKYASNVELTENYNFYCSKLIKVLFNKVPTTLCNKMFEMIENLIKISEQSKRIEYSNDIMMDCLNIPVGQYISLWMQFLACHKDLITIKEAFIKKYKNNRFFYYNLGRFYSYLEPLYDKYMQDSFADDLKNSFLEGFVNSNYNKYEDIKILFDQYSNEIKRFFEKDEGNITKQNLIYTLIHLLLVHNEKDLYLKLVEGLDETVIKEIFHSILYPTRSKKYDKNEILDLWKSAIDQKVNFAELLLAMFNEYCDDSDILIYSSELTNLFKLYNSNIEYSIELKEFMDKLFNFLKDITQCDESDKVKLYNLINELINAISTIAYVDLNMAKSIENIISEYKQKYNANDNVKILCKKICETVNLIKFSDMFYKYNTDK